MPENIEILTGPATGLLNQKPVGRFTLVSNPADPVGNYASLPPFSGTTLAYRVRVLEVGRVS